MRPCVAFLRNASKCIYNVNKASQITTRKGDLNVKVLVGMSGGLDSTYAAQLLLGEGAEVVGAVLRMHGYTECDAARESCRFLGIPCVEIDCRSEFDAAVRRNFIDEYSRGRTPNPCIVCNERVKFKCLYDYAVKNGFDKIATGHYARIVKINNRHAVAFAKDLRKDQSYMLYRLPEEILARLMLPLSDLTKEEIRERALNMGISAAEREESQDICFLPDGNYAEYIENEVGRFPEGDFVDKDGKVIGRHKGIVRYTVGQRKGLGISLGKRVFVTDINASSNSITLSDSIGGKSEAVIEDVVYSGVESYSELAGLSLFARPRYSSPLLTISAEPLGDGTVKVRFDREIKVAPGQSLVAYANGIIVFGGVIKG